MDLVQLAVPSLSPVSPVSQPVSLSSVPRLRASFLHLGLHRFEVSPTV